MIELPTNLDSEANPGDKPGDLDSPPNSDDPDLKTKLEKLFDPLPESKTGMSVIYKQLADIPDGPDQAHVINNLKRKLTPAQALRALRYDLQFNSRGGDPDILRAYARLTEGGPWKYDHQTEDPDSEIPPDKQYRIGMAEQIYKQTLKIDPEVFFSTTREYIPLFKRFAIHGTPEQQERFQKMTRSHTRSIKTLAQ